MRKKCSVLVLGSFGFRWGLCEDGVEWDEVILGVYRTVF